MVFFQTLLAFLVAICMLVLAHELGHYFVARLCGVKVIRFSLGVGKVLFSRRFGKDQTEWAISALPLGGYVMMLDARDQDLSELPREEMKREFHSQSVWRRMAIVLAGPMSNFLLSILILAGIYVYGIHEPAAKLRAVPENTAAWKAGLRGGELVTSVNGEPVRIWSELRWELIQSIVDKKSAQFGIQRSGADLPNSAQPVFVTIPAESLSGLELDKNVTRHLGIDLARPKAQIGKVMPDGPAMKAGLQEGDLVLAVDGQLMPDSLAFVELVQASPGKALSVRVMRGQQQLDLSITPEAHTVKNVNIGKIMAEVSVRPEMTHAQDSLPRAIVKSIRKTWDTVVISVKMIGKMIVGEVSWKNITGPVTIADYAGQTARIGAISYLSFMAFISISIGVMNLLPIPVLDGGLLLYYSLEVLTGRTISERAGNIAQRIGLGLLMVMMVVAIFNDIVRLIL